MNKLALINLISFLLLYSQMSLGVNPKTLQELFQQEDFLPFLKSTPISLSKDSLHQLKDESNEGHFFLTDESLSDLYHSAMHAYIQNIRNIERECQCNLSSSLPIYNSQNETIFKKKFVEKWRQFKRSSSHFLSELWWNEVEGFRRYGTIYVLINLSFEVIEHHLSPIPLCKLILLLSRTMSEGIKISLYHLFPFLINADLSDSVKLLFLKIKMRLYFEKIQLNKLHKDQLNSENNPSFLHKLKTIFQSEQLEEFLLQNLISKNQIQLENSKEHAFMAVKLSFGLAEAKIMYLRKNYIQNATMSRSQYSLKLGAIGHRLDLLRQKMLFHLVKDAEEKAASRMKFHALKSEYSFLQKELQEIYNIIKTDNANCHKRLFKFLNSTN